MNTKALLVCISLALFAQYSQASRVLLADELCPSNVTCTLSEFEVNTNKTLPSAANTSALQEAACCVPKATTVNCTLADACQDTLVLKLGKESTAVNTSNTLAEVQALCCEEQFPVGYTCSNETELVCAAGTHLNVTVDLAGFGASSRESKCCVANEACMASNCAAPWAAANTSVIPTSNVAALRTAECCVLPANATCGNWGAVVNASEAVIFNCSKIADFPAKADNAAISISEATLAVATAACCDAVYKVTDTCASLEFDCSSVDGFEANETAANVTLGGIFKLNEVVAAECCAEIPEAAGTNSTNTTKKNSAGAKAVSFGVSVLALLAMLLL